MEARLAQSLQFPISPVSEKISWRPSTSVRLSRRLKEQNELQVLVSAQLPTLRVLNRQINVDLEVSCSYKNFPGTVLESGSYYAPFDENIILKNKSQEIEPYLDGRCIYLVGMMGSGKTTVGKVLSQVLGYSFIDSDALIEQEVGGVSVAEIFKLYGEGFFRDKELLIYNAYQTEALRKLSLMRRLVISTGGGAVVRPINWKYMWKGISVWLDVPVEALAQRISAVGTGSRPLLPHESGDVFKKTFMRLSSIFEERSEAYANANARVSLENIASKFGQEDLSNLTPTTIAIEAMEQIADYLSKENDQIAF